MKEVTKERKGKNREEHLMDIYTQQTGEEEAIYVIDGVRFFFSQNKKGFINYVNNIVIILNVLKQLQHSH